jgi:hypothetical protein
MVDQAVTTRADNHDATPPHAMAPTSQRSTDLPKLDEQVNWVRTRTTLHHQTPVTEDQPQPSFWLLCLSTDVERSVALIGT